MTSRTSSPSLAIEDLAAEDPKAFGKPGAIYVGGGSGLRLYAASDADAEIQATLSKTLVALRGAALAAFEYACVIAIQHLRRGVAFSLHDLGSSQ